MCGVWPPLHPVFLECEMNVNTRAFIENSSNGHYIAAWSGAGISPTHPSTYADAYAIANTVSVNQYIYINP